MGPFLGFMPTKGISTQGENGKGGTGMLSELVCLFNPPPLVWREWATWELPFYFLICIWQLYQIQYAYPTSAMCTKASFIQYFENLSAPASTFGNRVCVCHAIISGDCHCSLSASAWNCRVVRRREIGSKKCPE